MDDTFNFLFSRMAQESNMTELSISDYAGHLEGSLLLRLPKFTKKIVADDFFPPLLEHIAREDIISLGKMKYDSDWNLTLSSQDARGKLLSKGTLEVKGKKCVVYPMASDETFGRVHWLPYEIDDDQIKEILNRFGEVVYLKREPTETSDSPSPQSCIRSFSLRLKSGVTKDDIPHFVTFNKFEGLVIVKGREPMCLGCRQIGHRKSNCDHAIRTFQRKKKKKRSNKKVVKFADGEGAVSTLTVGEASSSRSALPKFEPPSIPVQESKPSLTSSWSSSPTKSKAASPSLLPGFPKRPKDDPNQAFASTSKPTKAESSVVDVSNMQEVINNLTTRLESILASAMGSTISQPLASAAGEHKENGEGGSDTTKKSKKKKKKRKKAVQQTNDTDESNEAEAVSKEESLSVDVSQVSSKDSFDSGITLNHKNNSGGESSKSLGAKDNAEAAMNVTDEPSQQKTDAIPQVSKKSKKKKKKPQASAANASN